MRTAAFVSIHAPHEGERLFFFVILPPSTSVSIHAPHEGERRILQCAGSSPPSVSIHAPHEGERLQRYPLIQPQPAVSIHAPHEGERQKKRWRMGRCAMFQSTLPTRGSDAFHSTALPCYCGFNPRSPRGGATTLIIKVTHFTKVSIHAPHEGERLVIVNRIF